MNYNAAAGLGGMLKDGHKSFEGVQGAVMRNIEAAKAIAAITSTSAGPNGMNKLVVNHLEKIFVTSDCATIVKELEVAHPAAKMLVLAAEMQESEYGDNTNFVMSFAGELLKMASNLLTQGLHTTEICEGYTEAYAVACEAMGQLASKKVSDLRNRDEMIASIKSIIGTKQCGYEDFLSDLVVRACQTTFPTQGQPYINSEHVRIAKLSGGSVDKSTVIKGMVILRDAEGDVKSAKDAKVAVFGVGLEATEMEAKGTAVSLVCFALLCFALVISSFLATL